MRKTVLSLVLVSAVVSLPFASASAQAVKILYGSLTTPSSMMNARGVVPWLEKAKELSNQQIGYDLQSGGVVVTGATSLNGIRSGIVDGANIVSSYYPTDLPVNGSLVAALAFSGQDPRSTTAAVAELTLLDCPSCLKEFLDKKIVPVGPFATDTYSLLCRQPVDSLQSLKGLRVRSAGAAWGRLAQKWGMSPVNMATGEIYEGLQRGTVDCTFASLTLLKTLSLAEVTKNVLEIPVGSLFSGANLTLNLDKWKKLTKEQRSALIKAAPAGVAGSAYGYLETTESEKSGASASGITIRQMDKNAQKALDDFIIDEQKSVVEIANGRGVKDAAQIASRFGALLQKWDAIVKRTKTQQDFEAALWKEIYSKFPAI